MKLISSENTPQAVFYSQCISTNYTVLWTKHNMKTPIQSTQPLWKVHKIHSSKCMPQLSIKEKGLCHYTLEIGFRNTSASNVVTKSCVDAIVWVCVCVCVVVCVFVCVCVCATNYHLSGSGDTKEGKSCTMILLGHRTISNTDSNYEILHFLNGKFLNIYWTGLQDWHFGFYTCCGGWFKWFLLAEEPVAMVKRKQNRHFAQHLYTLYSSLPIFTYVHVYCSIHKINVIEMGRH